MKARHTWRTGFGRAPLMGRCGTALRRRLLVLCMVALTMVMASACGSGPGGADDRVGSGETEKPSDALAWAGFPDVKGLEVVDAGGEAGIDTLRMFLLRGSAEDVDRALAAAEFDVPPVTGKQVAQPPLEGFEPELLTDVVSGEDRWENAEGQTLQRLYVRGEEPGGQHVLHVWAFTT